MSISRPSRVDACRHRWPAASAVPRVRLDLDWHTNRGTRSCAAGDSVAIDSRSAAEARGLMPAYPKPAPRTRTTGQKRRANAAVITAVRAAVVERDGYCLFLRRIHEFSSAGWPPGCSGASQFAHLPPRTRAATREMSPDRRHATGHTAMLCRTHHDQVDGRRRPKLILTATTMAGADGPMMVEERP